MVGPFAAPARTWWRGERCRLSGLWLPRAASSIRGHDASRPPGFTQLQLAGLHGLLQPQSLCKPGCKPTDVLQPIAPRCTPYLCPAEPLNSVCNRTPHRTVALCWRPGGLLQVHGPFFPGLLCAYLPACVSSAGMKCGRKGGSKLFSCWLQRDLVKVAHQPHPKLPSQECSQCFHAQSHVEYEVMCQGVGQQHCLECVWEALAAPLQQSCKPQSASSAHVAFS